MNQAITLAWNGLGTVEPNPMVGCVLIRDGRLIGKGYHAAFGGPHAEAAALVDCDEAHGATAYVTLEPCCHHGKTPPCADALIDAGVSRVVVAVVDPFDQVDGGGLVKLREAGIEVVTGVCRELAEDQLAAYLKRVRTGMPWVIAKWAMSLDGRIATQTGESQWITGKEARAEVHRLRGRVDGVAVGMGTMIADDPSLTARQGGPRTPVRLVYARHRLPDLKSQLVRTASQTPTWVIAGPSIQDAELAALADHDVETWQADSSDATEMITESLRFLASGENPNSLPMTNLMVEGGGELLGRFASAGQIDECHVYLGGKLIGGRLAPGPVGDPGAMALQDAMSLQLVSTDTFGNDVRIIYRR